MKKLTVEDWINHWYAMGIIVEEITKESLDNKGSNVSRGDHKNKI